jgi:hypothetical protein
MITIYAPSDIQNGYYTSLGQGMQRRTVVKACKKVVYRYTGSRAALTLAQAWLIMRPLLLKNRRLEPFHGEEESVRPVYGAVLPVFCLTH